MLLRRNVAITWFVILWTLLFQYETLRANYLTPLVLRLAQDERPEPGRRALAGPPLPKLPLLFPPAGWIMFFNVDKSYGFAEVYGNTGRNAARLDPHDIFSTKAIGYDNIHRNVLVGVLSLSRYEAQSFCRYLHRKFPAYDSFSVVYGNYPDIVNTPDSIRRQMVYQCQ